MPSSLPSPDAADMPEIADTSVPDLASTPRNILTPQDGLPSSMHFEEDITIADAAIAATDADNVSFLRALPIDDHNVNDVHGEVGSNGHLVHVPDTASRRQTTSRSVAGDTNSNDSPRVQRLHSRAREIRVEDRALRDRLQRIIYRLNQARDHGNSDRHTSFGYDFESNWDVIAQDRIRNSGFDSHAYGHPSRRNQRGSINQTSAISNDDTELERFAHAFSVSYASWVARHTEEDSRNDSVARDLYRRGGLSGNIAEQRQRTEHLQHVESPLRNRQDQERYTRAQHGSHRSRRLPSGLQEHLTDTLQPERLALPAPVPVSATSTHLSLAQSNAALLQSARHHAESPNSASLTTPRTNSANMYSQRSDEWRVRTGSDFETPVGSLPSIASLENNIEIWNAPTQEQLRHIERTLQQLERSSNEARREMGRREWQQYQLRHQMADESENNTPALPTASTVSEGPEGANHTSLLEQTVENVFSGRQMQHFQERYRGLLHHDTQHRIDAYRRRYLENPGNLSTGYFHPTARQSTLAASTNSSSDDARNNRNVSDREIVDARINTFAMSDPPVLPGLNSSIPSPLSSYITAWPEQALRYLARLRSSIGFEESLAHAIVAGFATSEFFVEKHDDFAMEADSLPRPYETSWLAPGQVFCGFQKATAMNQKDGNRCRRHDSGSGGRRGGNNSDGNVGRNSAVSSRSYRFSNARPITSTMVEPPTTATRARSYVTEIGPSYPRSHDEERSGNESGQQRQRRRNHQRLQEPGEIRHELQRVLERIQRARQRAEHLQERQQQQQVEQIRRELRQQEQRQRQVERQLQILQEQEQQMEEKDEEREEQRRQQQQQQNRWPVKVTIHSVDFKSMTVTATMEARNVPSYPSPTWSSVLHGSSRSIQRNGNLAATNSSTLVSNAVLNQHTSSSIPPGLLSSATPEPYDTSFATQNSNIELTPTYSITTYLEGEIIDFHKHSLLTETYASNPEIDAMYWRRLEPFRDLTDEQLVRKVVSRNALKEIQQHYVLMRWKEQCFVRKLRSRKNGRCNKAADQNSKGNHDGQHGKQYEGDASHLLDHPSYNFAVDDNGQENDDDDDDDDSDTFEDVDPSEPDSACGLTISGFYYVCLRRSDGALEGLYYDPQSSPYQRLYLQPGFGDGGGSKRAGRLRREIRSWGQTGKTGKSKEIKKNDVDSSKVVKLGHRSVGVGDHEEEVEEDGELAWRNGTRDAGTEKGALGVFPNWVFR